jgi:hypothetical protein
VQAQADEADGQHHHHRLDQHRTNSPTERETACGWSCICSSVDAHRQLGARRAPRLQLALPRRMMSPPLAIDTPSAITSLALVPHDHRRRVDIAAPDARRCRPGAGAGLAGGRVDGADRQARRSSTERKRPPMRTRRSRCRRQQGAGTFDRVLRADLGQHLVQVQAQLGQPLLRDLDEDLLGLRAVQLHLGHVGHAQQLGRARVRRSRSSSGLKPSADSAKMLP